MKKDKLIRCAIVSERAPLSVSHFLRIDNSIALKLEREYLLSYDDYTTEIITSYDHISSIR